MSRNSIGRRSLLAALGIGGGALFLPSLLGGGARHRSSFPFGSTARADDLAPPKRVIFVQTQHGTVYENWRMRTQNQPDSADWELPLADLDQAAWSPVLAPLYDLRSNLLVADGLAFHVAYALEARPGINAHDAGQIGCLTGGYFQSTGTDLTSTYPSVDQLIAKAIARPDRFPSIEIGDMGWGNIYDLNNKPLPGESSPQALYDRLFPGTAPPADASLPPTDAQLIAAAQGNVLDLVRADYDRLSKRLSKDDAAKLAAHRDLIRDLQTRLAGLANVKCDRPTAPGDQPDTSFRLPFVNGFVPIVAAALACDLTRVVSFMMGVPSPSELGLPGEDFHEIYAHHSVSPGPDLQTCKDAMTKYSAYIAGMLAELAKALQAIPEGNGTVLDSTLIVWTGELANGEHDAAVFPAVLIGGGALGVKTGRYVHYAQNVPTADTNYQSTIYVPLRGPGHNKLLTSVQQIMGVDANQTGLASVPAYAGGNIDLTGPLPRLV